MELVKVVFIVSSVVTHALLSTSQLTMEHPGPANQLAENDVVDKTKPVMKLMFVLLRFYWARFSMGGRSLCRASLVFRVRGRVRVLC